MVVVGLSVVVVVVVVGLLLIVVVQPAEIVCLFLMAEK